MIQQVCFVKVHFYMLQLQSQDFQANYELEKSMIQKTTTFRGSLEPDAFTLSSCHFFIVVIVYLYLYFYFPPTPRIGPIFCIFITLIFFTKN